MTKKTIEQQIAFAQSKLNELNKKKNIIDRKARDRERYQLGGEVVKFFKEKDDRSLLIGLLSCPFSKEDKEKLRRLGESLINKGKSQESNDL